MNITARRATATLGALATAASLAVMAPAQSVTLIPSHVTAGASDDTPASGQTFRLAGAVWSEGDKVPATIRVKTYRNGKWVRLPGAIMETNSMDRYRIRIVLRMKGDRMLRVIGDPKDEDIATSRRTLTVTVH